MPIFPKTSSPNQGRRSGHTGQPGPLRRLAGGLGGAQGHRSQSQGRRSRTPRVHRAIDFQPIDPQANGPQLFYGLRYHIHINTEEEDITFHDQVGYWLWEPATGLVLQTLAIPRGQVVLARDATPDADGWWSRPNAARPRPASVSTAFLEYAFRTDSYRIEVVFNADGIMELCHRHRFDGVRGRTTPFAHRDQNTLLKVNEPQPNPLARIIAAKLRG